MSDDLRNERGFVYLTTLHNVLDYTVLCLIIPLTGNALSKMDCPTTPEEKLKCSKYPYRKVVGQLMYGMVRTRVTIMYALNILSRYGNNPVNK